MPRRGNRSRSRRRSSDSRSRRRTNRRGGRGGTRGRGSKRRDRSSSSSTESFDRGKSSTAAQKNKSSSTGPVLISGGKNKPVEPVIEKLFERDENNNSSAKSTNPASKQKRVVLTSNKKPKFEAYRAVEPHKSFHSKFSKPADTTLQLFQRRKWLSDSIDWLLEDHQKMVDQLGFEQLPPTWIYVRYKDLTPDRSKEEFITPFAWDPYEPLDQWKFFYFSFYRADVKTESSCETSVSREKVFRLPYTPNFSAEQTFERWLMREKKEGERGKIAREIIQEKLKADKELAGLVV